VACAAGVSQPTVSLVLSGRGNEMRVASATQQRVLAAAEALGYIPNRAAQSLRHRRSNVITVVSPSLENPFFAEVVAAVQDAALERGCSTNVVVARNAGEEARAIAHVRGGAADGVVVVSHYDSNEAALRRLVERGTPCVLLQQAAHGSPVASVSIDLQTGGVLATQHLIGLGHRRIAHLTQRGTHDGRRAGYLRALAEAGIAADAELIVETDNTLAGGSAAAQFLLASSARRPTAIFAFNDRLAFGVLHGATRAGLRVPEDLAVVGFDNTVSAAFSNPELTSIGHERNRLTVEMLMAMLDGKPMTASRQMAPVRLVLRESCGADRRAAGQKVKP
jgi:LacI family transcriptional regulator